MPLPLGQYGPLLTTYLRPQWPRAALLGGLLLTGIALELVNPQILRRFIDSAAGGADLNGLLGIAALFLGIALVAQLVTVAETYLAEQVGLTATNWLRADLMRHCLRLDPSFHATHSPGELIERVDGDVATLGNFFSRLVIHLLGNGLLLAGVLVLLFGIDWRVGLALTTLTLVALAVVNRLRDVAVPRWTEARQASADLFGFLEERLAGTEDVRANGATGYVMRRLGERSLALVRRERRAGVTGVSTGGTTIFLLAVGTAVALGLGAWLYAAGTITLGAVYLIFSYSQLLSRPIEGISRQMQDLQRATASLRRIGDLLALRSSVHDDGDADLPAGALPVAFQHVSFGYVAGEPVLRDVSFHLPAGQVLGLLGRTGSGKTTLTRLLFRLYDPTGGAICVDGVDARAVRLAALHRRIGIVTQEIQLFHASVRDNLTLFDRAIADDRIRQALADLGLSEWLASLPDGLDTKLAPGGGGISAGQAQLLAFARIFLRDPGLVILDEASSRLDPATEARVERAVDRLLAGRTGIIIAHRLATVGRADLIMILDEGGVVEYGPRAALARDPDSHFARLLRTGLEEVLV